MGVGVGGSPFACEDLWLSSLTGAKVLRGVVFASACMGMRR